MPLQSTKARHASEDCGGNGSGKMGVLRSVPISMFSGFNKGRGKSPICLTATGIMGNVALAPYRTNVSIAAL